MIFDEQSMLQEKSKTKDKAQSEASVAQQILRVRSLSFQMTLTSLSGQMKTSQI